MQNLLAFDEILSFFPLLIIPIVFAIVIVVIIATVIRRSNAAERKRKIERQQAQYPFIDGNGRTEHQRDYLNAKRRELAERKIVSQDGSHEHLGGKVEKYDKIVGSLGEVNDEGCDELDGVRLIEHDEAYCDDPDHLMPADPTDIQKAIVIGEVLNTPRFKEMYRRK